MRRSWTGDATPKTAPKEIKIAPVVKSASSILKNKVYTWVDWIQGYGVRFKFPKIRTEPDDIKILGNIHQNSIKNDTNLKLRLRWEFSGLGF